MKIDITELNVIDLKPGQVLVIRTEDFYDAEMYTGIKKLFPNNELIICNPKVEFEVINGKAQSQYR